MVNNYTDQRYLWNSMDTQMTSIWTLPSKIDTAVAEYPAAVIFSVHLVNNVLWLSAHPMKISEDRNVHSSWNPWNFLLSSKERTNALSQKWRWRKYMNEFMAAISNHAICEARIGFRTSCGWYWNGRCCSTCEVPRWTETTWDTCDRTQMDIVDEGKSMWKKNGSTNCDALDVLKWKLMLRCSIFLQMAISDLCFANALVASNII